MADPKRTSNTARAIFALTALAAIAVLVVLFLKSTREEAERAQPTPPPAPVQASAAPPSLPAPQPLLGRPELISAATAAASAYAAGAGPPPAEAKLIGRRFRLAVPFGCAGDESADSERSAYWSYGRDRKTLRITVRPEIWTDSDFVRELGGATAFEAVEGFWIPRPWLALEECPAQKTDPLLAAAPSPSPQTVGLAVFHEKGASRVPQRGGRPYEVVSPAPVGAAAPAPRGFRLVLEGRVVGYGDARAIRCRSASGDQRPVCLFRVDIEHVAIQDPASGALLGSWRN